MTKDQWASFCSFKEDFKKQCAVWEQKAEILGLSVLQSKAALNDGVPLYPLENPIVYNTALDAVCDQDSIKLIVIADNPGKDEQLHKNRKYLVGLSGKIAAGFFKKHPELDIDFRKNVIILNKTPVHTAKTKELKALAASAPLIQSLIDESQIWMAKKTAELHIQLGCPLWLVGYAELKGKGIFSLYRDTLKNTYTSSFPVSGEKENCFNKVFVFQHFSMNRFTIDLFHHADDGQKLQELLEQKGTQHRKEIFL